jgi:hypothetical protein
MIAPLTPSEQFAHSICTNSFLSLWCYNNPKGKNGKELCDILVVCEPDIVIFSVKDIALHNPEDQIQEERWQRKAVDESVRQLYGAAKWLNKAACVIHADGSQGIALPAIGTRRIHRVAIAFGSAGKCSIRSGDFGEGHVHVFTEQTLVDVLTELDTISDFVHYLAAKEHFLTNCGGIVIEGTEADLLGVYIHGGRTFPEKADFLMLGPAIWDEVRSKPEFKARKVADRESYSWDELIEMLAENEGHDDSEFGLSYRDREFVMRGMAREDRFCRRLLAKHLREFLLAAKAGMTRSRIMQSPSRFLYVLAYFKKDEGRDVRLHELTSRCLIARNKVSDAADVVMGIGFCEFDPAVGSATDLVYMQIDTSNNEWRQKAQQLEDDFGYFRGRQLQRFHEEEFPVRRHNRGRVTKDKKAARQQGRTKKSSR